VNSRITLFPILKKPVISTHELSQTFFCDILRISQNISILR
jgi:hypothetical protein